MKKRTSKAKTFEVHIFLFFFHLFTAQVLNG